MELKGYFELHFEVILRSEDQKPPPTPVAIWTLEIITFCYIKKIRKLSEPSFMSYLRAWVKLMNIIKHSGEKCTHTKLSSIKEILNISRGSKPLANRYLQVLEMRYHP